MQQSAVLWAASKGYLDAIERTSVTDKISEMLSFIESNHSDLVDSIMKEKALTDEIASKLDETISNFLK